MSGARAAAAVASALPMDHPLAQVARLRLDAHVRAERKIMNVETPVPGFTGVACGVKFAEGKAETEDQAALNYFKSAGYKVGGVVDNPAAAPDEPVDPRSVEVVQIGARLRDASVDGEDRKS